MHWELSSPHKFSLQHTKSHNFESKYLWIMLTHGPRPTFTANHKKLSLCNIICMTVCVSVAILHFICWHYSAIALITQTGSLYKVCTSTFLKKCPEPIYFVESCNPRSCIRQFLHMSLFTAWLWYCTAVSDSVGALWWLSLSHQSLFLSIKKSLIIWIHKTKIFQ